MKRFLIVLAAFVAFGCAAQPEPLTEEEQKIHVFFEEPKIAYENLERIQVTSRGRGGMETLDEIRRRAVELGADGILVHSMRNMGTVAGGGDTFGTGGGGGFSVYQIQATAIRYVEGAN